MTPFERHALKMLEEQERKGIRRSQFRPGLINRNRKVTIECGKL